MDRKIKYKDKIKYLYPEVNRGDMRSHHATNKIVCNRNTKKYQILRFLYDNRNTEIKYCEIARFIIETLEGNDYLHEAHRYHYGDNLVEYSKGMLTLFCDNSGSSKIGKDSAWKLTNKSILKHFKEKIMNDLLSSVGLDGM